MIKKDGEYERIQLIIPKDVLTKIETVKQTARRNRSNMIVVLVEEALKARESGQKEATHAV